MDRDVALIAILLGGTLVGALGGKAYGYPSSYPLHRHLRAMAQGAVGGFLVAAVFAVTLSLI